MIFDSHCHIGTFGTQHLKGRDIHIFEGREVPNALAQLEHMKENSIAKCVVVPHYTPDPHYPFTNINPIVLDAIKHPKILGGLWVNPMPDCTAQTAEVLDALKQNKPKGIVALKMSPTSWQKLFSPNPDSWTGEFKSNMVKILETAKDLNLVLHMHTSDGRASIAKYEKFVERYGKDIKIQLVHMGANAAGVFWLVPRFSEWVNNGYQVYADTSWCIDFGPSFMVKELMKNCPEGLNRIMFASDHPWGSVDVQLAKINSIDCPQEIKDKILFGNANALYTER